MRAVRLSFLLLALLSPLASGLFALDPGREDMSYGQIILDPTPAVHPPPPATTQPMARGNTLIKIYVVRNSRVSWFEEKKVEIFLDDQKVGSSQDFSVTKVGDRSYDLVTFSMDLKNRTSLLEARFNIRMRGYTWEGRARWSDLRKPEPGEALTLEAFAKVKKTFLKSQVYLDTRQPVYEKIGVSTGMTPEPER